MATSSSQARTDFALLLVRLAFGMQMALLHGWGKLQTYLGGATTFADPLGIGWKYSLMGTIAGEFLCGLALAVGLFSRIAGLGMAFTMGVAAFVIHGQDPWGKRELAVCYLAAGLLVVFAGAGRFSLDNLVLPRIRAMFGRKGSAAPARARRVEA